MYIYRVSIFDIGSCHTNNLYTFLTKKSALNEYLLFVKAYVTAGIKSDTDYYSLPMADPTIHEYYSQYFDEQVQLTQIPVSFWHYLKLVWLYFFKYKMNNFHE